MNYNDESFEAFQNSARAGGGWDNHDSYGDLAAGPKVDDRTPLPVTVSDLLGVSDISNHIIVGERYAFSTVRFAGLVASVKSEQHGTYIYYEVADPNDSRGVHSKDTVNVVCSAENSNLRIGSMVYTVGKLRTFDKDFGITCFHIHALPSSDSRLVEMFQKEAKIAKIYYTKDISNKIKDEMEGYKDTIFSAECPQPKPSGAVGQPRQPGAPQTSQYRGSGYASGYASPLMGTSQQLGRVSLSANKQPPLLAQQQRTPLQQQNTNGNESYSNRSDRQQNKILEYIRENHEVSEGAGGVSVEQIEKALKPDHRFREDLKALEEEGLIFTTTGSDVYSCI